MPRYSRWTAEQSRLATSDPAVTELTTKEDFWLAWDTCGRSFAGDDGHVGEPAFGWLLSTVDGFGPGHPHRAPYVAFLTALEKLPLCKMGGGS